MTNILKNKYSLNLNKGEYLDDGTFYFLEFWNCTNSDFKDFKYQDEKHKIVFSLYNFLKSELKDEKDLIFLDTKKIKSFLPVFFSETEMESYVLDGLYVDILLVFNKKLGKIISTKNGSSEDLISFINNMNIFGDKLIENIKINKEKALKIIGGNS